MVCDIRIAENLWIYIPICPRKRSFKICLFGTIFVTFWKNYHLQYHFQKKNNSRMFVFFIYRNTIFMNSFISVRWFTDGDSLYHRHSNIGQCGLCVWVVFNYYFYFLIPLPHFMNSLLNLSSPADCSVFQLPLLFTSHPSPCLFSHNRCLSCGHSRHIPETPSSLAEPYITSSH